VKIVVDCRYTKFDQHDGISRYGARIAEALGRIADVTMLIHDERQLALLPDLPWKLASAPTSVREPFVARQVNRLNPTVVFSPMQTMGSWGRDYGLVLTLHDLIYYRHRTPPRELPQWIRLLWRLYHLAWWPQRLLLNRADAVATISQTTRALIEEHHLTKRPTAVIGNAADAAADIAPRSAPPEGAAVELVYMGSFMPYKNVETLARAMDLLPGAVLHLCSRIAPETLARLETIAPPGAIIAHNGVTDDEYHQLLHRATALVTASRDEGFGIPLVEAMAVGTPVVVSDIPIFREIGGEAARYASPDLPADFASAISALRVPRTWSVASAAAREQAALFDWDRSAAKLLALLESVVTVREAEATT
jgi:glycosyltransferase involved in cell wall biosynthesis